MVEMKEGEVSILRSQLRDSKAKFETELEKKQKEMIEKLNVKTREVSAVQSELEFKVSKSCKNPTFNKPYLCNFRIWK